MPYDDGQFVGGATTRPLPQTSYQTSRQSQQSRRRLSRELSGGGEGGRWRTSPLAHATESAESAESIESAETMTHTEADSTESLSKDDMMVDDDGDDDDDEDKEDGEDDELETPSACCASCLLACAFYCPSATRHARHALPVASPTNLDHTRNPFGLSCPHLRHVRPASDH
jgi:hypothetical protein